MEQRVVVPDCPRQPAGGGRKRGGGRPEFVRERDDVGQRLLGRLERPRKLRDRPAKRRVLVGERADRPVAGLHEGTQLPVLLAGRLREHSEVVDELRDLTVAPGEQVTEFPQLRGCRPERLQQPADVLSPSGGRLPEGGEQPREPGARVGVE